MDNLINLHNTYDYLVKICRVKDINGVCVIFPANFMSANKIDKKIILYTIIPDGVSIDNEVINCPVYACRLLIFTFILLRCAALNINTLLALTYDENGDMVENQEKMDILDVPVLDEDKNKEQILIGLFHKRIAGIDCIELAEENSVLDGYNLIINNLSSF